MVCNVSDKFVSHRQSILKTVYPSGYLFLKCAVSTTLPLLSNRCSMLHVTQLCPLYPHNPEVLLNELKSPAELLDFGEFSDCMDFGTGSGSPLLHVVNPAFDYVPPKLVSLFITDT